MQGLHCSHTLMLQFMASVRFPMMPSVWGCWTWTKVSIRAYDAQQSFRVESLKRIDHYSRTARTSWNLNRWIGFRIDVLGASFTAGLAAYLVYGKAVSAANTGLSLNMAVSFCAYIFWLIRIFNELEVQSNRWDSVIVFSVILLTTWEYSLERIQGYLDIDHEPQPTRAGIPPAAWPTSGDLRVENLSARYSQVYGFRVTLEDFTHSFISQII